VAARRRGLTSSIALVMGVAVAVPSVPAGAATTPPPEPPLAPPPASPAFLPGIWKGVALGTGAISGQDVDAFFSKPFRMKFEFEVAPDGTVVNGLWSWTGEVSMAAEGVEATFAMTASGTVGGTGNRVEYTGIIHEKGSVTAEGQVIPIEQDVDAAGAFSATSVSCAVATGDVATEGRALQGAAGMATTVTGPFTARRTASPDAPVEFEEAFAALVTEAQALIAAGLPAAADVVALAEKAEDFYQNVFATGSCAGGAPSLLPGKQAYTYFVKVIADLVLTALANADAYGPDDVNALAIAALRIGVIGAAAPDPALAAEVLQALQNTLDDKLAAAVAAGDQEACTMISITAGALGMTQIWADAVTCAGG
jgi:hypothetical protein